ncbi:hypothetical protein [Staphylococcus haemolyticus]|uniref:hypothetical protein n=1 Tax=Staphylococcus haemolyticus TaxID=1283 RepID=UPI0028A54861|nr:hypothetical protein [Staphylococcus haemolyticus]MDT3949087.1 hypothetical protein [Staphylococcus haemolyticus]
MSSLLEEIKYCGFNFIILLFGYLTFYRPANESREFFQKEYGNKIKLSHFFNESYRNVGMEHISLYIYAIIIFIIAIVIAIIILKLTTQILYSPFIQILISILLIVMSLYSMINTYIASIILATVFIGLVIWAFTNDAK